MNPFTSTNKKKHFASEFTLWKYWFIRIHPFRFIQFSQFNFHTNQNSRKMHKLPYVKIFPPQQVVGSVHFFKYWKIPTKPISNFMGFKHKSECLSFKRVTLTTLPFITTQHLNLNSTHKSSDRSLSKMYWRFYWNSRIFIIKLTVATSYSHWKCRKNICLFFPYNINMLRLYNPTSFRYHNLWGFAMDLLTIANHLRRLVKAYR